MRSFSLHNIRARYSPVLLCTALATTKPVYFLYCTVLPSYRTTLEPTIRDIAISSNATHHGTCPKGTAKPNRTWHLPLHDSTLHGRTIQTQEHGPPRNYEACVAAPSCTVLYSTPGQYSSAMRYRAAQLQRFDLWIVDFYIGNICILERPHTPWHASSQSFVVADLHNHSR